MEQLTLERRQGEAHKDGVESELEHSKQLIGRLESSLLDTEKQRQRQQEQLSTVSREAENTRQQLASSQEMIAALNKVLLACLPAVAPPKVVWPQAHQLATKHAGDV